MYLVKGWKNHEVVTEKEFDNREDAMKYEDDILFSQDIRTIEVYLKKGDNLVLVFWRF